MIHLYKFALIPFMFTKLELPEHYYYRTMVRVVFLLPPKEQLSEFFSLRCGYRSTVLAEVNGKNYR